MLSIDIQNTTTINNESDDIKFIQLILETIANIIKGLNLFTTLNLSLPDGEVLIKLKENIQKVKENYTIEDKIIPMLVTKYIIQQSGKSREALPFEIRNKLNFYINNIPSLNSARIPTNGGYNKTIKNNKKKAKTYRKNKKQVKTYRKHKKTKKFN